MECKRALEEAKGDFKKAQELISVSNVARAETKKEVIFSCPLSFSAIFPYHSWLEAVSKTLWLFGF